VGCGWHGWAAMGLRFGLGIPHGATSVLVISLLPGAGALARRYLAKASASRDVRAPAPVAGTAMPRGDWTERVVRYLPRPWMVWLPIAIYVLALTMVVILHGINTPTHTDDGTRLRAFSPFFAFEDTWPLVARTNILAMAGALPTFVPAVAWKLTGTPDHFHANYTILTHWIAFLALALGLAVRAERPRRGWATAFAVLSLPLFVYHLTSTYQDATVALFAGAALLCIIDYARSSDLADASRALLLTGILPMVKCGREAVGGALAAVVLAHLVWRRRRKLLPLVAPLLLALIPMVTYLAIRAAAVGGSAVAPLTDHLVPSLELATNATSPAAGGVRWTAAKIFGRALGQMGNAGMLYWALFLAMAVYWRKLLGWALGVPLAAALLIFAEVAVLTIWVLPDSTLDQGFVNRALLLPSVLFAIWLAALLTDPNPSRTVDKPMAPMDPSLPAGTEEVRSPPP
jgi:hypothetical protein